MNTCDNMPGDTLDPRYGSICNSIAPDELSLSLSLSLSLLYVIVYVPFHIQAGFVEYLILRTKR